MIVVFARQVPLPTILRTLVKVLLWSTTNIAVIEKAWPALARSTQPYRARSRLLTL